MKPFIVTERIKTALYDVLNDMNTLPRASVEWYQLEGKRAGLQTALNIIEETNEKE